MTTIGAITFLAWSAIAGFLYLTNRDLCSPVKICHIYALYFFLGLYFGPETEAIYLIYWSILLVTFFFGVFEALSVANQGVAMPRQRGFPAVSLQDADFAIAVFWVLTIIPLVAQFYIVQAFGGLTTYFVAVNFRVRDFAGLGPIIVIIRLLPTLNLLYFGLLLTTKSPGRLRWLVFGFHILLTVILGIFTGSRSAVMMNLLLMALIFNYLRAPIRMRGLMLVAVPLLMLGVILGVARAKVKIADILVQGSNYHVDSSKILETASNLRTDGTTNSGLAGLRLVLDQGVPNPKFGQTYLAAITNLVPRGLWPDKPRTGGVILTEEYTGNEWRGLSNLSTGFLTEGMLNFGVVPGFLFGMLVFGTMMTILTKAYVILRAKHTGMIGFESANACVIFVIASQFVAGQMISEFANAVQFGMIQIASIALILGILRFVSNHRLRQARPQVPRTGPSHFPEPAE